MVLNKRLTKHGLPSKQSQSKKLSCQNICNYKKDSSFIKQVDYLELPELGELKIASDQSNQQGAFQVQKTSAPVVKKNFSNPVLGGQANQIVEMTANVEDEFDIEIEDSDDDQ